MVNDNVDAKTDSAADTDDADIVDMFHTGWWWYLCSCWACCCCFLLQIQTYIRAAESMQTLNLNQQTHTYLHITNRRAQKKILYLQCNKTEIFVLKNETEIEFKLFSNCFQITTYSYFFPLPTVMQNLTGLLGKKINVASLRCRQFHFMEMKMVCFIFSFIFQQLRQIFHI